MDFEFNEQLLLDTIDHVYNGRFGTFLFNNEKERNAQSLHTSTTSYWDHVQAHHKEYLNPTYVKSVFINTCWWYSFV